MSLTARVQALEAAFRHIAATRMAGVPVLHPGLRVQALGFETEAADAGVGVAWSCGVLITPWFMSLVRLPLVQGAAGLGVGRTGMRHVGAQAFEFLGADAPDFGAYETCSLFSPMHDFADHDAAVATAREVLAQVRAAAPPADARRRGFLLGRRADGACAA